MSAQYDETLQSLVQWLQRIKRQRVVLARRVQRYLPHNATVLEVGAGSAWLSALLSRDTRVRRVIVTEIDARRLALAQEYFAPALDAHREKMVFRQHDFHNLESVADRSVDVVVVDAALHHTDTPVALLQELRRILAPGGRLLAIREPVLPLLPGLQQLKRWQFGRAQIKCGDIEHTYTQREWRAHFANAGLHMQFVPLFGGGLKDRILRSTPLYWLNGVLYGRYMIIATVVSDGNDVSQKA